MHPILLVGAALAGLPILLHLIMKQEPKKLLFPAVRFLKQKQRTNQRKMRLRHLLLLLVRMIIIALFALALWQPKISGSALSLPEDQPVAVVIVLDNSPSMGYAVSGVTRLEDAKRRAIEFLAELPAGSKAAILETNDLRGDWEPTLGDARRRIEGFREPAGFAQPVTSVLAVAYQLFTSADDDGTEPDDRLPRVLAVFSDRTTGSWEAGRVEELKKARDAVVEPAPVQLYFDVGTDTAVNVSIVSVDMRPQLISATADAVLTVTVRADGAAVPSAEVTCTLDDTAKSERKETAIPVGGQQAVSFTYKNLTPGFHTATIRVRDDNLGSDNLRHFVFSVAEKRRILTLADNPETVRLWRLSHNLGKQEFDCTVQTPTTADKFDGYEAVCLISVATPTPELWQRLKAYATGGGKVFLAPPGLGQGIDRQAYNDAVDVMPAELLKESTDWRRTQKQPNTADRSAGVTWKIDDDRELSHPFLAPFRDWKKRGNVDIVLNPRRAWIYWETKKLPGATTVVNFDDADDTANRHPALLERSLGNGKVLLLTTRLDDPPDGSIDKAWNDYWAFNTTWPTVFPNVVARYLAGSPDDAVFNFNTGDDVTVPLPAAEAGNPRAVLLEGPGVADRESKPTLGANQATLRVTRPTTWTPGLYTVRTEDRKWQQRFALNVPAEESTLTKTPDDTITALLGPDAILPVGRNADLKSVVTARGGQPRPLFPLLLLLVLGLFVAEGVFANRFHRTRVG